MMDCRAVQELLPEYVTGRHVPDRERVAGHLCRCETCDAARRELEAVFALLAEAPGPPKSQYGEANTRLALRSEFAPGPLKSEWESLRREEALFRICAAASTFGAVSLVSVAAFVWKTPEIGAKVSVWIDRGIAQATQAGPLWTGLGLLVLLMGGMAALLPALMPPGRSVISSRSVLPNRPVLPGRRSRREV